MKGLISRVAVTFLVFSIGTYCTDHVQGQQLNQFPEAMEAEALVESPDVVAERTKAFSTAAGLAAGVLAQPSVAAVMDPSVTPDAMSPEPSSRQKAPADNSTLSALKLTDQQSDRHLLSCTDDRSDFCKRCNCNGTGSCGDESASSGCFNASSCWRLGYHSDGNTCWYCPANYPYYSCGNHRCYPCPSEYPNFYIGRCWRCPQCFYFSYQDGQCHFVGPLYGSSNCTSTGDNCGCPSAECRPRLGLEYAVCQTALRLSC